MIRDIRHNLLNKAAGGRQAVRAFLGDELAGKSDLERKALLRGLGIEMGTLITGSPDLAALSLVVDVIHQLEDEATA